MDLCLKNKRIVISGSSGGIGLGIARFLAGEGARVIVSGRDKQRVEAACISLRDAEGSARGFVGDLTVSGEIDRLIAEAGEAWGGIDHLVLNLGSGRSKPKLEADRADWERVFNLNLFAGFELLRAAVPSLAEGDAPSVVIIGSIAGLEALGAPWAYGAAKAAASHLSKQAARDLAGEGIRVNQVCPGNVFFEGGTWDVKQAENPGGVRDMLSSAVPLKRFGTVDEIAAAVTFLISPVSAFTTGACLVVDGGQTKTP